MVISTKNKNMRYLAAPVPSFRQILGSYFDDGGLSQALYGLETEVRFLSSAVRSAVGHRLGEESFQLLHWIRGARRWFSRKRTRGSVYFGTARGGRLLRRHFFATAKSRNEIEIEGRITSSLSAVRSENQLVNA